MKRWMMFAALLVLGTTMTGLAQHRRDDDDDRSRRARPTVRVMALNVYHGVNAEFAAASTATSFADFLQKAAAVFQGYHARNFPERAAALAAQIDAARPDLIGLQEAVLVPVPVAATARCATTAAAEPPLDPPDVRWTAHGLTVLP